MALTKPKPPAQVLVNIGDRNMYSSGAFIPNGDYIMEFNVLMHQAKDTKTGIPKGPVRLGVMVDYYPWETPTPDHVLQQFYSFGSKASEQFAPSEDGKGIVAIPGAKGGNLNDKTNWFLLFDSLLNSGLPEGVFTNHFGVLDGVWVHIDNVDEPAERGSYGSATSEVNQQERKIGKVAIVTEIKEGGAPWEGGGGIPEAAPATSATTPKATKPTAAKPRVNGPATRVVAPPAPATEEAGTDEEAIRTAAINAVSDVLEKKYANGCTRLILRKETFSKARGAKGENEEMAGAIISNYFEEGCEDNLAGLLGDLGYKVEGVQVKPA